MHLDETLGVERPPEPVEVLLSVPAEQADSLAREIRVARVRDGALTEVPCQVHGEVRRGAERLCKVLFMASGAAHERQTYLVFHGNPDAELPAYLTDLQTRGEGFALEIENEHFKASLSRQMGQLERLTIKREHGLELFAGGEGHGEPPGIDWAHDYAAAGHFQKLRITLWETLSRLRSGARAAGHDRAPVGISAFAGASGFLAEPAPCRCRVSLLRGPAVVSQVGHDAGDQGLRGAGVARRRVGLFRPILHGHFVDGAPTESSARATSIRRSATTCGRSGSRIRRAMIPSSRSSWSTARRVCRS